MMQLYLVEDDPECRKILYTLLRDYEYHKAMLAEVVECFHVGALSIIEVRDYNFKDMFFDQRYLTLKKIETLARDFYKSLLEDLKAGKMGIEAMCDEQIGEKLISTLETLVEWEEEHIEMVERLRSIS